MCDPWFSPSGAQIHRLHQFPRNDVFDLSEFDRTRFIYISHEHGDHFDPEFLSNFLDRDVTILLGDFISDVLYSRICALGFEKVLKLKDWERLDLTLDCSIQIVRDPVLYPTDSSIIIDADGVHILNFNDSHIASDDFARLKDFRIDLLFGQYCGAHWYPHVNGFSEDDEKRRAEDYKQSIFEKFCCLANGVGARYVYHNSGPFCFLHEDLFHLNLGNDSIYSDQNDAFALLGEFVEGEVGLLLPGDEIVFDGNEPIIGARRMEFDFNDKERYLRSYQRQRMLYLLALEERFPQPDDQTVTKFGDHLRRLFSVSPFLAGQINGIVRFEITGDHGGDIFCDLRDSDVIRYSAATQESDFSYHLPSKIAALVIAGRHTL